jgi:hypothetical protein
MRILAPVTFAQVRLAFRRDHPAERVHPGNTNREGEENLWRAEQLLGCWHAVLLCRADVLGVALPWHTSEGGGYELVPHSGLTVEQAAARMRARPAAIGAANPVCTAKLALLADSPLTPVYLSTRAVPHPDYAGVRARDALVHVDGLHRMLAWELAGRLPAGEELEAFVAGDPGGVLPPPGVTGAAGRRRSAAASAARPSGTPHTTSAEGALGTCSMTR